MKRSISFLLSGLVFFASTSFFANTDQNAPSIGIQINSKKKQLIIYASAIYQRACEIVRLTKSHNKDCAQEIADDVGIKIILKAASKSGFDAKVIYKKAREIAQEEQDKITELVLSYLSQDSVKTWLKKHPIITVGLCAGLVALSGWSGKKLWDWFFANNTKPSDLAIEELQQRQQINDKNQNNDNVSDSDGDSESGSESVSDSNSTSDGARESNSGSGSEIDHDHDGQNNNEQHEQTETTQDQENVANESDVLPESIEPQSSLPANQSEQPNVSDDQLVELTEPQLNYEQKQNESSAQQTTEEDFDNMLESLENQFADLDQNQNNDNQPKNNTLDLLNNNNNDDSNRKLKFVDQRELQRWVKKRLAEKQQQNNDTDKNDQSKDDNKIKLTQGTIPIADAQKAQEDGTLHQREPSDVRKPQNDIPDTDEDEAILKRLREKRLKREQKRKKYNNNESQPKRIRKRKKGNTDKSKPSGYSSLPPIMGNPDSDTDTPPEVPSSNRPTIRQKDDVKKNSR